MVFPVRSNYLENGVYLRKQRFSQVLGCKTIRFKKEPTYTLYAAIGENAESPVCDLTGQNMRS
jgi:hypothetical protein